MSVQELMARLAGAGVQVRRDGDRLVLSGRTAELEPALLDELRARKEALLAAVDTAAVPASAAGVGAAGEDGNGDGDAGARPSSFRIRPEMLTLVELAQEEIDRVVAGVEGGAANVQDIYPLAPLQDGILFHHLMTKEGDPYLAASLIAFESREALDRYVDALRAVVARHDVLRTSVAWEGVREPVQVVWRKAALAVEEVALDPAEGDAAEALRARLDPRHHRIDLRTAPMMRLHAAHDRAGGRWLLFFSRHHFILDHTTTELLWSEVEAHLAGRADALPRPLPFRNYVAQTRLGAAHDEQREFFAELLGDVDEPTAPFGVLDVRGDGSLTEEARLEVEGGLAARLRERARLLGVSAASVFHVAWAQVLARASGRDDVVFGTLLFGRMHGGEGAERAMGPFINTLPLRVRLGGAGAEACVRRTHALLARLLRHEHASLALAQRCSAVEAPAPLFTTTLNYRHGGGKWRSDAPSARAAFGGMRRLYGEERTSYPLGLAVGDSRAGFRLTVQAAHRAIDPARVAAYVLRALEGLVEALETAPERPVGSIDVLPEDERRRVVEEWNRTDAESPRDTFVHELFEARAARAPDAVAVVFGDAMVSYGELNRRANRLAHHLRALGVGPDARVAVCVERGTEMVAALLAVLKAGGAYVPLDPEYPEERLRHMLADSRPAALLARDEPAARFADAGVPVVDLDAAAAWAGMPETDPARGAPAPESLAYVIYTSGSTGTPKGVAVPHGAVANFLAWGQRHWEMEPGEALLQTLSFSFDASVRELFGPLLAGARLVVARPGGHRDPGYLADVLRRERIDTVTLPPAMITVLLAHPGAGEGAALRRLVTGAESLTPELVRDFHARFPGARLHHEYGPTETTVTATARACDPGGAEPGASIGRPVSNVRVYLLDAAGRPAPVGAAGEVHVAGAGVARGYLDRPAMTAERFVPDPFSPRPGARMYRTGDLGRWLADGSVEFLGRADAQVKVRGFRIEPGEVEARLAERAEVRRAVVVVREDAPGDRRLVAYWVGDAVEAEALRAHLAERLPEYMVPAAYVRLDTLPVTPNGKVDRRALPAPEEDAYARRGYEAPVGETERALAEIWSEVLGVERVSRWDDFFELGGHSLLAVKVLSRVQQVLGVDFELGELFTWPVLSELAREVEAAARSELPPIEPADRTGRIPLSFAQQRLWFMEQLEDVGGAYYIRRRLRLRGELDRAALLHALEGVVARHEALRTTFAQVDGTPEQRIAPAGAIPFPLADVDLGGRADPEAELGRVIVDEAFAPFDLERGPLIRGRLVRVAPDDHLLLVTVHHIVADGWSYSVFFRELSALYAAHREGREADLPALPVQYADYAVWQRRWVEGEVLKRQADYWTQTLAGAPELLELPTDRPRPPKQDHAGARVSVILDEALASGLRALSQRHGTTLYMTLLAGWAAVLGRLSGQDDVVIGSPMAGRGRQEIEGLIGFFLNTLALRVDLSGAPTVAELLERVKERALGAQHNQDIPFEQVVELLDPARSMAHHPLFQVMLTLQNTPRGDGLQMPGLVVREMEAPARMTAKFDLSLSLTERVDGRIQATATYAAALFDAETVERWLGYLRRVLEGMAADDAQPVERLPLMSVDERALVVEEWNRTEADYPRESCIHEPFEAQAARTPHAPAVVFAGGELTYGELNARANRLAHHLRALGVGPGARVGLCVERSPEMVVGVLGVLKSGGVFVPLDPSHPRERLEYMLADSAPAAVLARGAAARGLAEVFAALGGAPVLELDAAEPAWADRPATNPDRGALTPNHPAYVTYTSGSTGRPKGVPAVHHKVLNLVHWYGRELGITERDAVLLVMSFSFDGTYRNLFAPLFAGGQLHLAAEPFDPPSIVAQIAANGIGTINLTPTAFQAVAEADRDGALAGMRTVVLVGEAVQPRTLLALPEPRPELVNLYGPTECSGIVTYHRLSRDLEIYLERPVPAGRPIPNGRIYILDPDGNPVPVGVAGEIHIGGTPVGPGYQGRPEQTAERFVADPFSPEPGARMYRTGDLGRWLADGSVELLGRADFQVKVRGYRVEPGEIEARLREHPGVREAVVVAREDAPGEKRLVAYVAGDETAGADVLRAHLGERLPEYMVPAAYVRMEALPLTTSGKLDRKALPAPEGDAYAAREYEAPADETEEALAGIWAEVLRVERVGRHDNFFELGGHSLLAVQVISRVRAALEVKVLLVDLFTRPVLKDFAQQILDAQLAQVDPEEMAQLVALLRESSVR